jgi:hypothetical protein
VKEESKDLVQNENLGAWLIKCDPKTWDFVKAFEDGMPGISGWSVTDNYRSQMMDEGQPIVFWVSGQARNFPISGIWGVGLVTGPRRWEEPDDEDDDNLWIDKTRAAQAGYGIPTDIRLLTSPEFRNKVSRESLKKHRILSKIEVMRAPQAPNPSFLTKTEYAALRKILPSSPEGVSGKPENVTLNKSGAGFGNPETNRLVEQAAMDEVTKYFRRKGFLVVDVSAKKMGWDLELRKKGSKSDLLIEVKGVSGESPKVLLTRNEMKKAIEKSNWKLAVVTESLSKRPKVTIWAAESVRDSSLPFAWEVNLKK